MILEILEKYASKELGGVLHCFNASAHLLPLANMNFYFGIGGVVTFKNAKKLIDILPLIPKEKTFNRNRCTIFNTASL